MTITNKQGINVIEYLLLFAVVVIVLLLALAPNGFLTDSVNESLEQSIEGIETMANNIQYNVYD